jgi:hypothetical protein
MRRAIHIKSFQFLMHKIKYDGYDPYNSASELAVAMAKYGYYLA